MTGLDIRPMQEAGVENAAGARYSAAYPTDAERIVFSRKERKGRKDLNHEIHEMVITV